MWILNWLPNWIFYGIFFAGLLGLLATYVMKFIPFVYVYRTPIQEDAPVNAVGGGQIAGVGVGAQGEPGIKRKKKVASFISFMRRKAPV